MMKRLLSLLMVLVMAACWHHQDFDLPEILSHRPEGRGLVFDYSGRLESIHESAAAYLSHIFADYRIEIAIAVFPTLGGHSGINEAAAEIFSNWDIGRSTNAQGLLILLVEDIRQVKIEVGYALEDVFTDAFTGHIQDLQLQPRFASGQLDIGLLAVLEELEARAALKFRGGYTPLTIVALDAKYLSQGAGAGHRLSPAGTQLASTTDLNPDYPAGKDPAEAWQTMIRRWQNKVGDPHLGVYTPLTRLMFRDFIHLPDARYEEDFRTYAHRPYEVRRDGDFAVIYFGNRSGWENAPFVFCRNAEGWQFDMVHQRRFIRMGKAPHWGVEFSEHPYMALLEDLPSFNGQDIPLTDGDRYTLAWDAELADTIVHYESLLKDGHQDAATLTALGRIYAITAMGRKAVPLLQKALDIDPQNSIPHKYLAIAHVDALYQYDTAIAHLKAYTRQKPDDIFGYNFLGYLYYRKKQYANAVDCLENTLALDADNCYAHFYLSYAYAGLILETSRIDPRRTTYKQNFDRHVARTRSFAPSHPLRVEKLNRWLADPPK